MGGAVRPGGGVMALRGSGAGKLSPRLVVSIDGPAVARDGGDATDGDGFEGMGVVVDVGGASGSMVGGTNVFARGAVSSGALCSLRAGTSGVKRGISSAGNATLRSGIGVAIAFGAGSASSFGSDAGRRADGGSGGGIGAGGGGGGVGSGARAGAGVATGTTKSVAGFSTSMAITGGITGGITGAASGAGAGAGVGANASAGAASFAGGGFDVVGDKLAG